MNIEYMLSVKSFFSEIGSMLPLFFLIALVFIVVLLIVNGVVRSSDESKPLQVGKAKIIEKIVTSSSAEWYIIEFEDGKRRKLRNLSPKTLIISYGDYGRIEYKGETIKGFYRYNNLDSIHNISSSNEEWHCPSCGTVNKNYVHTCRCGVSKP